MVMSEFNFPTPATEKEPLQFTVHDPDLRRRINGVLNIVYATNTMETDRKDYWSVKKWIRNVGYAAGMNQQLDGSTNVLIRRTNKRERQCADRVIDLFEEMYGTIN